MFQNCKNMLKKLLKVHKLTPFQRPKPAASAEREEESFFTPLKIVHAGGMVECFYMATPAARIMEKYPSFLLARPQVFRQPWDSVVGPDEILHPGEKFFVVPRRTVRKLKRRITKPSSENPADPFMSQSSNEKTRSQQIKDGFSRNVRNPRVCANTKHSSCDKHDITQKKVGVGNGAMMVEKKGKEGDNSRRSSNPDQSHGRKIRGIRN
jgi:hypothetical protein